MPISKLSSNASLREVMDKFEEISLQDFSNIDIVVKSELPNEVKNGRLVIIDSNTSLKVIASSSIEDEDINNIFMFITNIKKDYSYDITSKSNTLKLYISYIRKHINGNTVYLNSYLGVNGKWVQFTSDGLYRFKDGQYHNNNLFGEVQVLSDGTISILEDGTLEVSSNSSGLSNPTYNLYLSTVGFDVTNYSELVFDIKELYCGYSSSIVLGLGDSVTSYRNYLTSTSIEGITTLKNKIIKIDISKITGKVFIKSHCSSTSQGGHNYIRFNSISFH